MSLRTQAKHVIMQVLSFPPVNRLLRAFLSTAALQRKVPDRILTRVPVNGAFAVNAGNGKSFIMVGNGFDSIANRVYWRGRASFEPEMWAILARLAEHSRTFLDIGANVGFYSLAAATVNPGLSVLGFEPIPRVAQAFQKNAGANAGLNITVIPCAISDRDGTAVFHVPQQQTLPVGATARAGLFEDLAPIEVPTVRLDTYLHAHVQVPIDFMKVDTETTEPAVFRGAIELLKRDEPVILCEVLPGYTEDDLHAVLDPLGFEYYWIRSSGLERKHRIVGDPLIHEMNYLFVTPRKAAALMAKFDVSTLDECFPRRP